MPVGSELGPSTPDRCAGCGERLGAGPWWMLDGVAYHQPCAPWDGRPFPLAGDLRRLRALRSRLARALAAIDDVGRALRDAERRWPRGAADVLTEGRRQLEALDARLRELGWKR